MKFKLNWKVFIVLFIVCGGLLYLTQSFVMTLGILLVLIVVDGLLKNVDDKRKRKANNDKIMHDINADKGPKD